jgi:hypothetical protein
MPCTTAAKKADIVVDSPPLARPAELEDPTDKESTRSRLRERVITSRGALRGVTEEIKYIRSNGVHVSAELLARQERAKADLDSFLEQAKAQRSRASLADNDDDEREPERSSGSRGKRAAGTAFDTDCDDVGSESQSRRLDGLGSMGQEPLALGGPSETLSMTDLGAVPESSPTTIEHMSKGTSFIELSAIRVAFAVATSIPDTRVKRRGLQTVNRLLALRLAVAPVMTSGTNGTRGERSVARMCCVSSVLRQQCAASAVCGVSSVRRQQCAASATLRSSSRSSKGFEHVLCAAHLGTAQASLPSGDLSGSHVCRITCCSVRFKCAFSSRLSTYCMELNPK